MKAGFIGFGLIGGSIAKALKEFKVCDYICAYDYYALKGDGSKNPNLQLALNDNVLDDIYTDLNSFSDLDIIYLCAPVKTNIHYLKLLSSIVKESCIITDVGSVKGDIHKEATKLGLTNLFVGGHPMAGSEKTGYINASPSIIENAYYLITCETNTPNEKVTKLLDITRQIGSIPIRADYIKHDKYVAAISHVPHIVAVCLVNMVRDNDTDGIMKLIAAGGFKDITRIGSSSPVMWENICINNRDSILEFLDIFRNKINEAYDYVSNLDGTSINKIFTTSKEYRDSIGNTSSKSITSFYEIYVDVKDEKGAIATIATLLAQNDINIKNIGIVNNREFDNGVLRIELKTEAELNKAGLLLKENAFVVYHL